MADASSMIRNWQAGGSTGGTKYREGINGVTEHPGQKAAAQAQLMLQKVTEAVTSGRWARNVSSYNFQNWKTTASGVGATNWANGFQKGLAKYSAAAQALAPRLNEMSAQIKSMPKGGAANAKARSAAAIDFMMGLKGIGKGGG
jgi:hypothetical protein